MLDMQVLHSGLVQFLRPSRTFKVPLFDFTRPQRRMKNTGDDPCLNVYLLPISTARQETPLALRHGVRDPPWLDRHECTLHDLPLHDYVLLLLRVPRLLDWESLAGFGQLAFCGWIAVFYTYSVRSVDIR